MAESPETSMLSANDTHDHAWSKVHGDLYCSARLEYRCDVCSLTWALEARL